MTWSSTATRLLEAARAGLDEVGETPSRIFLAPTDRFARDCSLLAVAFAGLEIVTGGRGDFGPTRCPTYPIGTFRVVWARDCYPAPKGAPPTLPAPDEVTDWTTSFLDGVAALHGALLALRSRSSGLPDTPGGHIDVGAVETSGPEAGIATATIPVRVTFG